jgi:hypothetical protein
VLSLLVVPALAQAPETGLDAALPKLEPVCYARFYDAAHLRKHPRQKVSSVRLVRDFPTIRLERSLEAQREAEEGRTAYFRLIVTYRDRGSRRFVGSGSCRLVEGVMRCSSDSCDGGGFRLRVEDRDTLLIGDAGDGAWFTTSGGCAGGEGRSLNEGADDRIFRLTRMPVARCR